MICSEDKLNTAINAGCPTVSGLEHNGFLCLRSEIIQKAVTAGYIATFYPSFLISVAQPPTDNAFKPKADGERNSYGLTKFTNGIEVFIIANTSLTQQQILQLKDEDWVFIGRQFDGKNIVVGLERGLRLKTTSQELNSTDTHGGILLTFEETLVNTPMAFLEDSLYNYFNDNDFITVQFDAVGTKIYLEIDSNKTASIKYLNTSGGYVTSNTTAGVYSDSNANLPAGNGLLIIPKTTTLLKLTDNIGGSEFKGNFVTYIPLTNLVLAGCLFSSITANKLTSTLNIESQPTLTKFTAPYAYNINANGCSLTAKCIGDWLFDAARNNPNESGSCYFTDGNNAYMYNISLYMFDDDDYSTLLSWIESNLPNYNITFN